MIMSSLFSCSDDWIDLDKVFETEDFTLTRQTVYESRRGTGGAVQCNSTCL